MKHNFLRFLTLTALIFGSLSLWASTQYCETNVKSTIDNTSPIITVSVYRVSGTNKLHLEFKSDIVSGIRAGGTFQQWGNGAWKTQDDAVANFHQNWTNSGNVFSKEFEFSTYPTSGSGQIYVLFDLKSGSPAVAGFTLTDVDLFASCSAGPVEEDTEAPIMTSATWVSNTHNSAVIAVAATDNVGITKYVVYNNATQQGEYTPSDGKITVTGLTQSTSYTLTIKAKDAAGNESAEGKSVTFTTNGDPKADNTECSGWNDDIWASQGGYNYDFSTTATDVVLKITAIGEFPAGMAASPEILFIRRDGGDGIEGGGVVSGKTITWTFSKTGILTRDGNPYLFNDNTIHFKPRIAREAGVDLTNEYIYTVGNDCQEHAVEGVSITSTFTQLEVGQSMTMTAAVTPANATNKNVTWSITSGSSYASINSSGTLTGNAEGSVTVQVETVDGGFTATKTITIIAAKPSAPSAAPANPTHPANKVKAIYSATYSADCSHGAWGGSASFEKESTGIKIVLNSGNGYVGFVDFGTLNCATMEKFHADVWVKDNASMRFVPIITGQAERGVTKQLLGGQWNSIDIALNEGDWAQTTDWTNVYQLKIDNAAGLTFWINNIYFYTTAEETKYAVSAIAGDGGSATVSAASVASGTEVTFTATPDCGYQFDSWTKGGEVVTGAGDTYTTAITEETTLTANFTTTFAPVTPTHETTNVKTVYGHYGEQTGLKVDPWWDWQQTQYNATTIGGKTMARYTNINFQGWDFDAHRMNVSDMQYVHLDLYASVESNIMFALIWQGGEHSVTKHLNGCTMESLDIPLSEFTNADLTTIRQLKFDAQGLPLAGHVLIVQNIYFYKLPPAPVESVTITNAPSEMAVNSDLTLLATIAPVNAANKNVTWSITAGSDYATIGATTGLLHANSAGQVTVQVTTEDGGKTDSKTITIVGEDVPVFPFTDDPTGDQLTQLSAWLNYYYNQTVDFTLPRSLSSSYFNTICLPFGLSSFAGTPFEGATVAALVDATVEGIDHSLALTLVFQPVTSMAAGVPYIIQPASDLTNPRFDDVTISATEAGNTVVGNANFVGCFAPKDVTNSFQNVFLAANNTLKWNEEPATIKGYRGYFAITGVAATSPMRASAPRLVIRNTPTEMQNAESTLRSEKVIRNGQLVIIRNGVEYNAQGQVIQ